jgi:hypothetical protein
MKGFKGTPNREGRPAGAKNKLSNEIREMIHLLVSDNLPQLQQDLNDMKPTDRVKAVLELASFVVPKLKAIEFVDATETNFFQPVVIKFRDEKND